MLILVLAAVLVATTLVLTLRPAQKKPVPLRVKSKRR
jgi:hypothetical protein